MASRDYVSSVKLSLFNNKVKFIDRNSDNETLESMYIDVIKNINYKMIFLGKIYGIAIYKDEDDYIKMATFIEDDNHWHLKDMIDCGWIYDMDNIIKETKAHLNSKYKKVRYGYK